MVGMLICRRLYTYCITTLLVLMCTVVCLFALLRCPARFWDMGDVKQ